MVYGARGCAAGARLRSGPPAPLCGTLALLAPYYLVESAMGEGKWWQGGLKSPNSVGSLAIIIIKAIRTRGPNATLSVSLCYHGTGKRDHGTEREVELSKITVSRGTGMGRDRESTWAGLVWCQE